MDPSKGSKQWLLVYHAPCSDGEACAAVGRLTAASMGATCACIGLDPNGSGDDVAAAIKGTPLGTWLVFADVVPAQPAVLTAISQCACVPGKFTAVQVVDHHASNAPAVEALAAQCRHKFHAVDINVVWTASGPESAVLQLQSVLRNVIQARLWTLKTFVWPHFLSGADGTVAKIISDCDTTGKLHPVHTAAKTASPATIESWLSLSSEDVAALTKTLTAETDAANAELKSRILEALKKSFVSPGPGPAMATVVLSEEFNLTPMDMNMAMHVCRELNMSEAYVALRLKDRVSLRPIDPAASCLEWVQAARTAHGTPSVGGGHEGAAVFPFSTVPVWLVRPMAGAGSPPVGA